MRRFVILAALGVLIQGAQDAGASNETLSFRRDAAGVVAVVSGLTNYCNQQPFYYANSVERAAALVSINSIATGQGGGCPVGTPSGLPYEVVAGLGDLPPGNYTVTWTTSATANGPRVPFLSAELFVPDDAAARVPALSVWGLVVMLAVVLVAGARRLQTGKTISR